MLGLLKIEVHELNLGSPRRGFILNGFHAAGIIPLAIADDEVDDRGFQELLGRIGISCDEVARAGDSLALSKLSLKILRPLRLSPSVILLMSTSHVHSGNQSGDKFAVKARISNSLGDRLYFAYFIFKMANEEPILEAKATVVWLDKNYHPARIHPEFRSKFVQFLHCEEPN
ncbi:hypothetical protein GOBAR_DD05494 [Gossypium barbadense]|nr:hypothetical protein GOBAR_DD05494 [Gossypium barbadense]